MTSSHLKNTLGDSKFLSVQSNLECTYFQISFLFPPIFHSKAFGQKLQQTPPFQTFSPCRLYYSFFPPSTKQGLTCSSDPGQLYLAQTGAQLNHKACSTCLQYVQKQPSPLIHTDKLHLLSFRAKSYQVQRSKTSTFRALQIRYAHFSNVLLFFTRQATIEDSWHELHF